MQKSGAKNVTIHQVNITTTGSAGSATGTGYTDPVNGFLVGIRFDFHASAPATTDTTVADVTTGRTLLTLTNTVTDVMHIPQKQASDNTGAAITGAYCYEPVSGQISIALAQCDALTNALVAYVYILEG